MACTRKISSLLILIGFFSILFLTTDANGEVCKKRNGRFPKPGSLCRSYYACRNWKSKEIMCPEDKHFSPAIALCVSPKEYPCSETSALPPTSFLARQDEAKVRNRRSLIVEFNWPKMKKGLKRFPHVMSCHHFYATKLDGKHVIKKCPDEEIFDFPTLRCSGKASAKCWSDQFKTRQSKQMTKMHFVCPFTWGLYPDIEDCSQFFNCVNGKPYHRKCPSSTLFDKVDRKCVAKSTAMCANVNDVVEPGYRCPYTWGFFTYAKDCSKYYECLQKNPSLRSCKRDFLFDNQKRKCLPKNTVECGTRFNPYAVTSTKVTNNDPPISSLPNPEVSPLLSDSSSSEEDSSEEVGKRKSTSSSKNKFSTISFKPSTSDSDSSEEDKVSSGNKRLTTDSKNKYTKLFTQSVTVTDSESSEEDNSTESKDSSNESELKFTKLFTDTVVTVADSSSSEEDNSTESKESFTETEVKSTKLFTDTVVIVDSDGPGNDTGSIGNESLTTASESKSTKLFTDKMEISNSDNPGEYIEFTENKLLTTPSESKSTKLFTDIMKISNSDNPGEYIDFTENKLLTTPSESKSTKLFTDAVEITNSDRPREYNEFTGNKLQTTPPENKSTNLFTDTTVTADSDSPTDNVEFTGDEHLLTKSESNSTELSPQ